MGSSEPRSSSRCQPVRGAGRTSTWRRTAPRPGRRSKPGTPRSSPLASRSAHPAIPGRARALDVRNESVRTQTLPASLLMPWSRREAAEAPAEVARLQLTLALCHCERGEYADAQELVELAEAA